jgi:hypothetical protein
MVGCNQPVSMALMVAIASSPPAAPRQCPVIDCKQNSQESVLKKATYGHCFACRAATTKEHDSEGHRIQVNTWVLFNCFLSGKQGQLRWDKKKAM